jgi:hypothetical protein
MSFLFISYLKIWLKDFTKNFEKNRESSISNPIIFVLDSKIYLVIVCEHFAPIVDSDAEAAQSCPRLCATNTPARLATTRDSASKSQW